MKVDDWEEKRFFSQPDVPRLGEVRALIERKFNSERNVAKAVAFGKFKKKKQKQNSFCG